MREIDKNDKQNNDMLNHNEINKKIDELINFKSEKLNKLSEQEKNRTFNDQFDEDKNLIYSKMNIKNQNKDRNIFERLKTEKKKKHYFKEQVFKQKENILDDYKIKNSLARVKITLNKETFEKKYNIKIEKISPNQIKNYKFIKETLFTIDINPFLKSKKKKEEKLKKYIDEIIHNYHLSIDNNERNKIEYFLKRKLLNYGKIDEIMKDHHVEEIHCNGPKKPLYVSHSKYGNLKTNVQFSTEEELYRFVLKLAQKTGKHLSYEKPVLDSYLPDQSSIHLTLGDQISSNGSTFTINKIPQSPFTPLDLIRENTMSYEMLAYFWLVLEHKFNVVITGKNDSGKTSTLNAISFFIPKNSKIMSLEKKRELTIPSDNWIPEKISLADKIDFYQLLKSSISQEPDYLITEDIEGRETYLSFQAMSLGLSCVSTIIADSAQDLLYKLEVKPIDLPRVMLRSLDLICVQTNDKVKNKRLRRCRKIIEVIDVDPKIGEILTNEVFRWNPEEDKYNYSGKSYLLELIRKQLGLSAGKLKEELNRRVKILKSINNDEKFDFKDIADVINLYRRKPKVFSGKNKFFNDSTSKIESVG
ncbi:MAG: type II/IV secretion system ATPase subunit [Candidatus Thermoplasmatota archaeon]